MDRDKKRDALGMSPAVAASSPQPQLPLDRADEVLASSG